MIQYPLCNGQGVIYEAKIITKNVVIYIYDECDAMWTTKNIQPESSVNFKNFMHQFALKGLWEELTDITIL